MELQSYVLVLSAVAGAVMAWVVWRTGKPERMRELIEGGKRMAEQPCGRCGIVVYVVKDLYGGVRFLDRDTVTYERVEHPSGVGVWVAQAGAMIEHSLVCGRLGVSGWKPEVRGVWGSPRKGSEP